MLWRIWQLGAVFEGAGSLEERLILATLLIWKVHLSLSEGEKHSALHSALLYARATRHTAGRPRAWDEAEHTHEKSNHN